MSATPAVAAPSEQPDVTMERLEDQLQWYSRKASYNQNVYRRIKTVEIIAAAFIPLLAGISIDTYHLKNYAHWLTAFLGVMITTLEGILQLNNYQQNWTNYRATAEALKHEKYLFLAGAPPYDTAPKPRLMLAERVEGLLSQENVTWVSIQKQPSKSNAPGAGSLAQEKSGR